MKSVLITTLLLFSTHASAQTLTEAQGICIKGYLLAGLGFSARSYCEDITSVPEAICLAGYWRGVGFIGGSRNYCENVTDEGVARCLAGWLFAGHLGGGHSYCSAVTTVAQGHCLQGWLGAGYVGNGLAYCGVD